MKTIGILGAAALAVAVTTHAFAGDPPAPARKAPSSPGPTPPAEMAELKWLEGSWKCEGTTNDPTSGHRHVKATMTWKRDPGRFWLVGQFAEKKAAGRPALAFQDFWTWDAPAKRWQRVHIDNMGGWATMASLAASYPLEFAGEGAGMGLKFFLREVVDKRSDREVHATGMISMDGKQWVPAWEIVCKR